MDYAKEVNPKCLEKSVDTIRIHAQIYVHTRANALAHDITSNIGFMILLKFVVKYRVEKWLISLMMLFSFSPYLYPKTYDGTLKRVW